MTDPQTAPVSKPPRAARPPAAKAAGSAECRHCHQWETSADDAYCGFCGHLQLALEIQPEVLTLISTLAPARDLVFRNLGPQPVRVALLPRGGPAFPALVFEPAGIVDVAPDGEARVRVGLDDALLPADFQSGVLDYVCLVNDDRRKQLPLRITIRSGPRPKLLTPSLQFGEVQEGKAVERALEIANSGGTPLNVKEVRPEGSSRLRLKAALGPSVLQPGQRLTIPLLWDNSVAEAADGAGDPGVRLSFGNHPDTLFVPARAKSFRYLLELRPESVALSQVLAKEDRSLRVEIENRGTADLEITGIESDQPWLEVVSRARSFTLLCADSAGQRSGEISPTTFARVFDFRLVCRPQGLPAGRHQARVTVRPLGQEPRSLAVEVDVVHPRLYPDYVGIDFGTSNSVVAVFNQATYDIELVEDDSLPRSPLIPSVLVFEDAETWKIGQAAKNEMGMAPDRAVRSIKRIMGYDHERELCGRKFSPEELAACIIRKLVQLTERKLHASTGSHWDVRKAIITVPANFFDLQIRGVLAACKAAGLDTEEDKVKQAAQAMIESLGQAVNAGVILDEPSAAVLYYIQHLTQSRSSEEISREIDREGGLRLLVFDYGGGTLDVSVANVVRLPSREAGLQILANMGDNGIGGDSIDLILMRELLQRCRERCQGFAFDTDLISVNFRDLEAWREREGWNVEAWREVLRVRSSWKDLSEAAKIALSGKEKADVEVRPDLILRLADGRIQTAPKGVKLEIPASLLRDLMQGILDKCRRLVESALDLAGLSSGQIDYILHTGRQSQMPLIRQCVREIFPHLPEDRDLLEQEHLKVCVAKGAALYGWMRDKLVLPEARIHLLSEGRRLPHSYGVEKFANLLQPELDEIIRRGAAYPVSESKVYGAEMIPPSGYLNLKFYQNTGTRKAIVKNPQVSLIGQISINTLLDGEPGCKVHFVIDANRKLDVFADGQEVSIQPVRLHGEESWMG